MSDQTADRIIEQCRDFISDPENNFLTFVFSEKLDILLPVTDKKNQAYKKIHNMIIQQKVIPAYQNLIQGLIKLKGTGNNKGGLYYLPQGTAYYEYLLKKNCGLYESIPTMQSRLYTQLQKDYIECNSILEKKPDLLNVITSDKQQFSLSPEEILQDLQRKYLSDFPVIPDINYEIKYVYKSMEEHLSPAFYLTPPIDTLSPNSIYINPQYQLQGTDLYTTLAHEGFPGHLYQSVYFSLTSPSLIRSIVNTGGYTEGWATYVESYAYSYCPGNPQLNRLLWLNRSINLCLLSLIDIGIHYYGWTMEHVSSFLSGFGITNTDSVTEIYQTVIEDPTNYIKYYMGYLHFLDLKEDWINQQTGSPNIIDFHVKVLKIGPCPFPILEKYMEF